MNYYLKETENRYRNRPEFVALGLLPHKEAHARSRVSSPYTLHAFASKESYNKAISVLIDREFRVTQR